MNTDNFEVTLRRDVMLYLWLCRANGAFGPVRHWREEPKRLRLGRSRYPDNFPFCSVPVTVLAFLSLSFALVTLVWRLAARTSAAPDLTSLFHVYLGIILFVSLWIPEIIIRRLIVFIDTAENVNFRDPQLQIVLKRNWGQQVLFLVLGALIAFFTVRFLYETTFGESFFLPLAIPAVLIGALWGVGGYTALWNGASFAAYLRKVGLNIFPLDPRHSPDIVALTRLFETVLLANSVAVFVVMLPLFSPNRTIFTIAWIGCIGIVGVISQIGLYIYSRRVLSRIVESSNARYLGDLRKKITALVSDVDELTPERYSSASPYISLYEKVVSNSKQEALGATRVGYFIRAFLLPIIAFALNGGEIFTVVSEIINAIFAA